MMRSRFFIWWLLLLTSICTAQESYVLDYSFGSFKNAQRLALDNMNRLYVSDAGAHTVTRFTVKGAEEKTVGGAGWEQDQFDTPMGIDASNGIDVYVADYNNHRIQRYDRAMSYIGTLSLRDATDRSKQFGYPVDVATSRFGNLFILDLENARVAKVNSVNSIELAFGSIEAGKGQLRNPLALRLDATDDVYVLEPNRIVVFDSFGSFRRIIGEGIVSDARCFAIDRQTVYVFSSSGVWTFTSAGEPLSQSSLDKFMGAGAIDELRDVAIDSEHLYLLTAKTIFVFHKPHTH